MKTASLLIALTLCVFVRAEAEPSRVWKLWDGKAPGDFTVPGPELVTPPKPGENPPILRLTNVAEPWIEIYEPAADVPESLVDRLNTVPTISVVAAPVFPAQLLL